MEPSLIVTKLQLEVRSLFSALIVFSSFQVSADDLGFRLTFTRTEESRQTPDRSLGSREYPMPIWFAGDKVRIDRKEDAIIYRRGDKKLYILHHAEKTYQVFDTPFTLEELITQEERDLITTHLKPFGFELEVEKLESEGKVEGCATDHFVVNVHHEWGRNFTYDLRTCAQMDAGIDVALFEEMIRYYYELNPLARAWIERILELPGMAVEQTVTSENGRGFTEIVAQKLQSITKTTVDPALFSPPQDYERMPLGTMVQVSGSSN